MTLAPGAKEGGTKVIPIQGKSVLDMFNGSAPSTFAGADQIEYELSGKRAFFDGDWKVLWMPEPMGNGEWESFNLQQDPAELTNLNSEQPDRLKTLVAKW